MNAHTYAQTHT